MAWNHSENPKYVLALSCKPFGFLLELHINEYVEHIHRNTYTCRSHICLRFRTGAIKQNPVSLCFKADTVCPSTSLRRGRSAQMQHL